MTEAGRSGAARRIHRWQPGRIEHGNRLTLRWALNSDSLDSEFDGYGVEVRLGLLSLLSPVVQITVALQLRIGQPQSSETTETTANCSRQALNSELRVQEHRVQNPPIGNLSGTAGNTGNTGTTGTAGTTDSAGNHRHGKDASGCYGAGRRYNPTSTPLARICVSIAAITAARVAAADWPTAGTFTGTSNAYNSNT